MFGISRRTDLVPGSATAKVMSPDRDRALDVLRIGSLLVVVTGHGFMLLVVVDEAGLRMDNLLGFSAFLQAATWLLQILPLFFFAGAAASLRSACAGRGWGPWLFSRTQRLYRPVFYYLMIWIVVFVPLLWLFGPANIVGPIIRTSLQPLWFIGVYVLVLAFLPLLGRLIRTRRSLVLVILGLCAVIAVGDAVRLAVGAEAFGLANFLLVWLLPVALGVGYARKLIPRGAAACGAAAVFAVDIALVTLGPYEISLVTVPSQQLSNMMPPSLLLAGHALVLCLLAVAVAPWLDRWAHRPRVWRAVAVGNSGAMTLYMWHVPAIIAVFGISHGLGEDRSTPTQPGFVTLVIVQMVAFYVITGALFLIFLPLENRPLPWWDDPVPVAGGGRSVLIGAVVTVSCGGTLLLAAYGLSPPGLITVAVTFALLALARGLSFGPQPVAVAQRHEPA